MKRTEPTREPPRLADLTIPRGCPACEGPVQLRVTPNTTAVVCLNCHFLARPMVLPRVDGDWELAYGPAAFA